VRQLVLRPHLAVDNMALARHKSCFSPADSPDPRDPTRPSKPPILLTIPSALVARKHAHSGSSSFVCNSLGSKLRLTLPLKRKGVCGKTARLRLSLVKLGIRLMSTPSIWRRWPLWSHTVEWSSGDLTSMRPPQTSLSLNKPLKTELLPAPVRPTRVIYEGRRSLNPGFDAFTFSPGFTLNDVPLRASGR